MRYWLSVCCIGLALVLGWGASVAEDPANDDAGEPPPGLALMLEIQGAIGPATTDYLTRSLETAAERKAGLVIVRMDTPGGLTAATRDIVQAIRNSEVPVAVWVAPEGAQAASAGTYILYASHVAAMAPATNVGAATPVSIAPDQKPQEEPAGEDGEATDDEKADEEKSAEAAEEDAAEEDKEPAADEDAAPADDPKTRKAVNDAAAWIRSLAQETGRNAEWAERAVREAVSLTAREAVEQNVADLIAGTVEELLEKSDGRIVKLVDGSEVKLATANLDVEKLEPDWRSELLAVITNPTVAYLLMMIGIYGLLLEGYNPGAIVPGTVGAICLLLALYAFQVLPVNYAGLLLIILGIILMVSEAFMPSFGALGIGGVVAMIVGSIILMDTDVPGFTLALEVIAAMGLFASGITALLIWFAVQAWRHPVVSGSAEVLGARGEVLQAVDAAGGQVHMLGERWQARADSRLEPGTPVRVVRRDGLLLHVESDKEE